VPTWKARQNRRLATVQVPGRVRQLQIHQFRKCRKQRATYAEVRQRMSSPRTSASTGAEARPPRGNAMVMLREDLSEQSDTGTSARRRKKVDESWNG